MDFKTVALFTLVTQLITLLVQIASFVIDLVAPGFMSHTVYSVLQVVLYIPAQILFVAFIYHLYKKLEI